MADPPSLLLSGRSRCLPNFKVDEDVKLTSAYVLVSTNAAVGTDQDFNTFWDKIHVDFVLRGGNPNRSVVSLQNRFNKVIQKDVNKYIGNLQQALRQYRSGWIMDDYTAEAKKQYHLKHGTVFKHEQAYSILRRLPKFEIVVSSCKP
jgi:hypothetical protein